MGYHEPNYPFSRGGWPIFGLSAWESTSQTPSKSSLFTLKNTLLARFCAHFALDLNLLARMYPDLSRHFVRLQPVNFESTACVVRFLLFEPDKISRFVAI
jgi:hypothetical protein